MRISLALTAVLALGSTAHARHHKPPPACTCDQTSNRPDPTQAGNPGDEAAAPALPPRNRIRYIGTDSPRPFGPTPASSPTTPGMPTPDW
jgi:hypothetical protein